MAARNGPPQVWALLSLAIAVPMLLVLSQSVWLTSVYTGGSFHLAGFLAQYDGGVFRYRLLGRDLLLGIYRALKEHIADSPYPTPRDPAGTFLFYCAFTASNGICLFVANLALLRLMWTKARGLRDSELAFYFYYTLLLALSMAVVTPYDQMAYMLLLLGLFGTRTKGLAMSVALVSASAVFGTLNRETEFLLAPALATLALFSRGERRTRYLVLAGVQLGLSALMYLGLRVRSSGGVAFIQNHTHGGKWAPASVGVICLLMIVAISLGSRVYGDVRPSLAVLALGLPYWITILVGGQLRELRLTVPVVLSVFCVAMQMHRDSADGGDFNAGYPTG